MKRISSVVGAQKPYSITRVILQWRWCDMTPFRGDNPYGNHPRASALGLTNEKVVKISASNIRCSVVTESGKIATWLDESVAHVCARLEHPATAFAEFGGDKVKLSHLMPLQNVA